MQCRHGVHCTLQCVSSQWQHILQVHCICWSGAAVYTAWHCRYTPLQSGMLHKIDREFGIQCYWSMLYFLLKMPTSKGLPLSDNSSGVLLFSGNLRISADNDVILLSWRCSSKIFDKPSNSPLAKTFSRLWFNWSSSSEVRGLKQWGSMFCIWLWERSILLNLISPINVSAPSDVNLFLLRYNTRRLCSILKLCGCIEVMELLESIKNIKFSPKLMNILSFNWVRLLPSRLSFCSLSRQRKPRGLILEMWLKLIYKNWMPHLFLNALSGISLMLLWSRIRSVMFIPISRSAMFVRFFFVQSNTLGQYGWVQLTVVVPNRTSIPKTKNETNLSWESAKSTLWEENSVIKSINMPKWIKSNNMAIQHVQGCAYVLIDMFCIFWKVPPILAYIKMLNNMQVWSLHLKTLF